MSSFDFSVAIPIFLIGVCTFAFPYVILDMRRHGAKLRKQKESEEQKKLKANLEDVLRRSPLGDYDYCPPRASELSQTTGLHQLSSPYNSNFNSCRLNSGIKVLSDAGYAYTFIYPHRRCKKNLRRRIKVR